MHAMTPRTSMREQLDWENSWCKESGEKGNGRYKRSDVIWDSVLRQRVPAGARGSRAAVGSHLH